MWMTNLPSAETSSSVLKFSEQGFITGSWCYGIYRRAWTKASARQSILLCHQFRYLFWPSTQGLFFWAEPQSGPLTDGKSIRKGRILRSAVGREETRMVMSKIGIEKRLSAEKWRCDKSVTEWEVWKSLEQLFTHQHVNESCPHKRKNTDSSKIKVAQLFLSSLKRFYTKNKMWS